MLSLFRFAVAVMPILVIWFGLTFSSIAAAMGPERAFLTLPERGVKSSGFTVSISCEELRLFGDVPFHIRIDSSGGPFAADRSLSIRIKVVPRTTQPPGRDCEYELPMQIAQGTSTIEKTFYLPKWSVGGELEVVLIEDRRPIDGYEGRLQGTQATPNLADIFWMESAESRFGWIVDDDKDEPDARVLMAMLAPELLSISDMRTTPGFAFGEPFRQFRVVKQDDLPTDWRGFDAVDVWVIEAKTLTSLFKNHPKVGLALRSYILCGGTMWVIGDVVDQELEKVFRLPPHDPKETKQTIVSAIDGVLQFPDLSRYNEYRATQSTSYGLSRAYLRELSMRLNGGGWMGAQASSGTMIDKIFDDNLAWLESLQNFGASRLAPDDFSVRSLGLGLVVVCKSPTPLPGTPNQWLTLGTLTGPAFSETAIRAVDPCFGDRRYWDWIIPDVAQPPVYTFIGLLLVFTIVVGPISYRKFTKLGRGYLMMFVAPLLAFATTLMMFAYGLVADGLSTRARIREITWIGDTDQNAVRYCRSTYFAGVSPTEGLRFPANSIVLPYQLASVESWYEASTSEYSTIGSIRLTDESMRMDRGFLPSRQQKQFVTYRPVEDLGTIDFVDQAPMQIRNTTAMTLRDGVIRNEAGEYFSFSTIEPKSVATATPITKVVASEMLSTLYTLQRPIAPAGVSTTRRQGEYTVDLVAAMQLRDPRRQTTSTPVTSGESRIEGWLRTTLQIESQLSPGMFIALSDVTDDCIAVPGTELDESIHFVVGVMP